MGIPCRDVIKPVAASKDYQKKLLEETTNIRDYYKSDGYSAYLFWQAVNKMERNEPSMTQVLANLVDSYLTQPRILDYGCGTGLIALGLKGMNCEDITLAAIPNKYSEFLVFISEKYKLGIKFIWIQNEYPLLKKYDIIINEEHIMEPEVTLLHLVEHLEYLGYIYLDQYSLPNSSYRSPMLKKIEDLGLEAAFKEDGEWRVFKKM